VIREDFLQHGADLGAAVHLAAVEAHHAPILREQARKAARVPPAGVICLRTATASLFGHIPGPVGPGNNICDSSRRCCFFLLRND
jgi:hypothetical protein